MSGSIEEFSSYLDDWIDVTRDGLINKEKLCKPFTSESESEEELLKKLDRSKYLEKLKGHLQGEHSAADFVPDASRMDYLASAERDLRSRYRSRLDNYRAASLQKGFIKISKKYFMDKISEVTP